MSNISRHEANTQAAGVSTGGQFKAHERAPAAFPPLIELDALQAEADQLQAVADAGQALADERKNALLKLHMKSALAEELGSEVAERTQWIVFRQVGLDQIEFLGLDPHHDLRAQQRDALIERFKQLELRGESSVFVDSNPREVSGLQAKFVIDKLAVLGDPPERKPRKPISEKTLSELHTSFPHLTAAQLDVYHKENPIITAHVEELQRAVTPRRKADAARDSLDRLQRLIGPSERIRAAGVARPENWGQMTNSERSQWESFEIGRLARRMRLDLRSQAE